LYLQREGKLLETTFSTHDRETIAHSHLFEDIPIAQQDTLLSCLNAKKKSYGKDEYVLRAGDKVAEVGIVLSGGVNITKDDFEGNRSILSKAGPGAMFAEAFVCSNADTLPVSVISTEKTEILFIDYKRIATVCSSACGFHNSLINNMMGILARKNVMLTEKVKHTGKRTTKEKLLSYLSTRAIKAGSPTFDIPFNRQELADYLGVDRSAMSAELCKLRDAQILSFERNHFTLY